MGTALRHRYRILLPGRAGRILPGLPFTVRHPDREDRDGLAELMVDAYQGTIDYEGEGIDEAVAEVTLYLAGRPMLDSSWIAEDADVLLGGVLLSLYEEAPLVGYIMTRAVAKGHGVAAFLLEKAISDLQEAGWSTLDAFITSGNTASERLFTSAGALRVA